MIRWRWRSVKASYVGIGGGAFALLEVSAFGPSEAGGQKIPESVPQHVYTEHRQGEHQAGETCKPSSVP